MRLFGGVSWILISSLYFQKVAELQHMTKAAEELNISQAALSQAIRSLERELGVQLFERVGRNIALSAYGQVYLSQVSNALVSLKRGENYILDLKKEKRQLGKTDSPDALWVSGPVFHHFAPVHGFQDLHLLLRAARDCRKAQDGTGRPLHIPGADRGQGEFPGLRLHTF